MLGVSHDDLREYGAVSEEIARQMATGAKEHSNVAGRLFLPRGIAGPGGGMPGKPVGLVHFGWCIDEQQVSAMQKYLKVTAIRCVSRRVARAERHHFPPGYEP